MPQRVSELLCVFCLPKHFSRGGGKRAEKENQITFQSDSTKQAKRSDKLASPKIDRPDHSSLAAARHDERVLPMRIVSRTFSDSWKYRQGINNFKPRFMMSFRSLYQCWG